MRIQHNIPALNAFRNYTANSNALAKNLEKLSSGLRINRAGDDAAGLAISEKMRAQITGLQVASKNAKDGVSLVQTAEGALTEVHDMLNRMYSLAEQSANGTYANELDREQLQKEVDQLRTEINRIADSANFNGIKLLDGSMDAGETVSTKFTPAVTKTVAEGSDAFTVLSSEAATVKGEVPGISFSYIQNRPTTNASYVPAEFTVDFNGVTTKNLATGDKVEFNFGSARITYTLATGEGKLTMNEIAKKLVSATKGISGNMFTVAGSKIAAAGAVASGSKVQKAARTTKASQAGSTLKQWLTAASVGDKTITSTYNITSTGMESMAGQSDVSAAASTVRFVVIDGHAWEIATDANGGLKFTQLDKNDIGDDQVNPNYKIEVKLAEVGSVNLALGNDESNVRIANTTTNDPEDDTNAPNAEMQGATVYAQNPVIGMPKGASRQARVEAEIDFSQLKDGDKITIGHKNYLFKLDSTSTVASDSSTNTSVIDLTDILKKESDYTNADKLNQALAKVVKTIGSKEEVGNSATRAWIAGNEGITAGTTKGKIYFQSHASFAEATSSQTPYKIGGGTTSYGNTDAIDMTTQKSVMAQFDSEREKASAKVTVEVDVTNLREGDYITIDGNKYEFAKSRTATMQDPTATRIILSGLDEGFKYKDTSDKVTALQDAFNNVAAINSAYTVKMDGQDKLVFEAIDDRTTTAAKENERLANIQTKFNETTTTVTEAKTEKVTTQGTGNSLTLQIGDTADSFNQMKVDIKSVKCADIKVAMTDDNGNKLYNDDGSEKTVSLADIDISTQAGATEAMAVIKGAINYISDVRGTLGATQNRLEHSMNSLSVMHENIQDAESSIRDTNVAEAMMDFTRESIKLQASQAMLAQANQLPQGVLQFLG